MQRVKAGTKVGRILLGDASASITVCLSSNFFNTLFVYSVYVKVGPGMVVGSTSFSIAGFNIYWLNPVLFIKLAIKDDAAEDRQDIDSQSCSNVN